MDKETTSPVEDTLRKIQPTLLPRFFFGTILDRAALAFNADRTAPHFDFVPALLALLAADTADAAWACPKGVPAL